jgi:hypothetical protein
MLALKDKLLREPLVALGVLAAGVVIGFKAATGSPLALDDLLAVLVPLGLVVGVGRSKVTPI